MASQPSTSHHDEVITEIQHNEALPPTQQPQLSTSAAHTYRQASYQSQASHRSNGSPPRTADTHAPPHVEVPVQTHSPSDAGHSIWHSISSIFHRGRSSGRPRTSETHTSTLVTTNNGVPRFTYQQVGARMEPTLTKADEARQKAKSKAHFAKWSMMAVAGIQVFLGALTTGLAALRLEGPQLGVATTILGIMSTLAGSYIAHTRATNEPETSLFRVNQLDSFIRKLENFILDHGYDSTDRYDRQVNEYRHEFEVVITESARLSTAKEPRGGAITGKAEKTGSKETV